MELSFFLAQLFGLSLAIFAGATLHQPALIRSIIPEIGKNMLVTLLASFAGIMGGLAVILTHNVWVASWPVLITIFGWAALIKGVAYLFAPAALAEFGAKVYSSDNVTRAILFVTMAVGIYLAGAGFGWF